MRTYLILQALIKSTNYLSLNYLVDELKVSKRTVQNELAFIKKTGDSHGYNLVNVYGKGYWIEITDQIKFQVFLDILSSDRIVLNEEQLVVNVLSVMLMANRNYTPVSELADRLDLSSTMMYAKLNTIDSFISSFGLKMERRSHYGVRLIGSSKAMRMMMLDFYLKGDNQFKTMVDERVGNFDEYERLIEDYIRDNHLRIGYYEFQQLMAWLKVLIIYSTGSLALRSPQKNTLSESVMPIMQSLNGVLQDVMKSFQLGVDEETAKEFSELVKQSAQQTDIATIVINKTKLRANLVTFFTASDLKNHTGYSKDEKFLDQLTTHLSFLLDRLDQKITYKNPLLLELCIRYPMVFDLVLKFSAFLENEFGTRISNDELGFIAVNFLNHTAREQNRLLKQYERVAVICTTGGGVANLVRNQILELLPLTDVRTFSFWEGSDLQAFGPDLIFSVVPLKQEPHVPTIYINELLTNRDLMNIKRMLSIDGLPQQTDATIDASTDYINLIKPDLFRVTKGTDYAGLITGMAQQMIDLGYGDKDYLKNVMLREGYMSTVYNNGIAMPHPLEMKGRKSAIAVTVVKPELTETDKKIRLVFMVCLAKQDFQYYSSISNGIYCLMQNDQLISRVYNRPVLSTLITTLKGMDG